jgi:hypothetical protein
MHSKLPVILLSALALAAPGVSYAKDKDKNKDKGKGHQEQTSGDHHEGEGHHDGDGDHDGDGGKMTICHVPPGNKSARHTITVGESAWQAHQAHGDYRGACRTGGPGPGHDPRFDNMDRDHNGAISAGEWTGDRAGFARLDANHDGVLSRGEFSRY